jgi:hypothetical protein
MTCLCGENQIPGGIGAERARFSLRLTLNGKVHTLDACTPTCEHGLHPLDCDECSLARKQAEARARAEREPDRMYDTAEPWER